MKLRLEEWMQIRGMSQAQIADALGIGRQSVNAWINGQIRPGGKRSRVWPDPESLEALCLFLECTPNDLLQLERDSIGVTWRDVGEPRRGRPPKAKAAEPSSPAQEDGR